MISFYLNDALIQTDSLPGMILLDFLRTHQNLKGTKIGCREGDCGACTVLVGFINQDNGSLEYKSVASCLTLLGHVHNKHVVTIEGINDKNISFLTPIQESFSQEATQCGFCTPGFIVSATGYFLSNQKLPDQKLVDFLDGNICRCTGYKSIERACDIIIEKYHPLANKRENLQYLVTEKIIPNYFLSMEEKLRKLISNESATDTDNPTTNNFMTIGGGTDLLVQKPDEVYQSTIFFASENNFVLEDEQSISIGSSITTEEFFSSEILNKYFPNFHRFKKLVASNQIRNTGTVGGNIVNASPIADLTIILLALNASVVMKNKSTEKNVPLRNFFLGYKTLAKEKDDSIAKVIIPKPNQSTKYFFNFEKISKRTHLDIASVNSAIYFEITNEGTLENISISAGGIAPIPLYLEKTCNFLTSKIVSTELIASAMEIAREEISPISDIRGSKEYKSLLLGQLILAHFISLLPNYIHFEEMYT